MDIISSIYGLIKFILTGISNFVDFFLSLPTFIYNLIEVLPEPIRSLVLSFIGIIIFIIIIYTTGRLISSVK